MRQISHVVLALKVSTVQALLIDTLVSGQLLLRPPSENPVFLNSYTKSAFLHSCKRPVTVAKILSVSWAYPLTRASIASLIFNHLLLLKWRPRKKLDVRDWDKTICVNPVPWVLEISKSVKCFQKKNKRFGFITLLLCEKNRCTVLGNIIDIIKMIGACKRVIAREGCIWCLLKYKCHASLTVFQFNIHL